MNRLIVADIKSPVVYGKSFGHFHSLARNYLMVFHQYIKTIIAGGPAYVLLFTEQQLLQLPCDLNLIPEKTIINKCKYFTNAWFLFRNCREDIVIVQQGADVSFFIACALFYRRSRKNRLYLIQYSTAAIQGRLKRMVFRMAKRKIDGIICPNNEVGQAYGLPYCVVPDYIYAQDDVESIPYEKKQYDLCFLGHLAEEKGVAEFLECFANTPYKMIIAGLPANDRIADRLKLLTKTSPNITLRLEFISDEEYKNYLHRSRFGVLNYQGEYSKRSSGAVLDMIFNDVPIIGLDCKALEFVKHYNLGYIYQNLESLDLSKIIKQEVFDSYISNLASYKQMHVTYRQKLGAFLKINM